MLSKMVLACLSIFHGPLVESSFSCMGNILDSNRYNMNIDTFNSYQTCQYYFRAHDTDAVKCFSRKNPQKDDIDRQLCNNIKSSYSEYRKVHDEKPKRPILLSKKAAKEKLAKEEKAARLAYEKRAKRRAQTASLEELRQKMIAKKKKS